MAKKRSKGGRVTASPKQTPPVRREQVTAATAEAEPMTPERAIRSLQRLAKKREQLDRQADELVAVARDAGVSWERIGAALGMTGNGARKRFAGS